MFKWNAMVLERIKKDHFGNQEPDTRKNKMVSGTHFCGDDNIHKNVQNRTAVDKH
jgi:hypothetical protein